ncbi:IclR family transcriptional regulator [Lentzea tibetensis]|uniref:Glycerol operon regulatory protein n=1 Tax=Lentzea tibetensis TaxID=2591470 RepID=A0A563EJZ0_9PSEU|nr:IclR family transcriptional regulator [Lentzea tibetensis]TWP46841.1 IclR family transcriptional regulator [Lentzea tibetensis]
MPGPIQSIERAAAILRLLSSGARRMSVGELARALELPKGTVHGILRTLQLVGFVEQSEDGGPYRLGAALFHIGTSYLDGNELRTRALNWSDSLAARSMESVRIGTLHEGQVLVVHHVFRPDNSSQVLEVGALLPAHATALGKVLLATDPVGLDFADPVQRFTPRTLTDPDDLTKALDEVRELGWAAEVEELVEGEVSIAAPIRDRRMVTVGAIGVSGPIERLCDADRKPKSQLVSYVREAARAISRELGALPW